MPPKKRKLSDLTAGDAITLLLALNEFQQVLDEDDDELPNRYSSLIPSACLLVAETK